MFTIPTLKISDRFETAIEKCVELGISNFNIFFAERSSIKREKIDRWQKIANSAMKQSLRSFLPKIECFKSIEKLNKDSVKLIFDQKAEKSLSEFLQSYDFSTNSKIEFIFGPEGGLTEKETGNVENSILLKLSHNRLRAETAVITAAAILNSFIER